MEWEKPYAMNMKNDAQILFHWNYVFDRTPKRSFPQCDCHLFIRKGITSRTEKSAPNQVRTEAKRETPNQAVRKETWAQLFD